MKYIKISITVEEKLLKDFKEFCKENAMKVSTRIQLLMKEDIGGFEKNGKKDS